MTNVSENGDSDDQSGRHEDEGDTLGMMPAESNRKQDAGHGQDDRQHEKIVSPLRRTVMGCGFEHYGSAPSEPTFAEGALGNVVSPETW